MGIEGDVPKQQYDLGWFGMDLFLLWNSAEMLR